jgi:hypothetical protein
MNFIQWVKADYRRSKDAYEYWRGNKVSTKRYLLTWYIPLASFTFWLAPLAWYRETRIVPRKLKKTGL